MIYVFIESEDPCGEGIRADLHEFNSREAADAFFVEACQDEDVRIVKEIVGTVVSTFDRNADTSLPTSEEILKVSNLTDIDDLDNKEKV